MEYGKADPQAAIILLLDHDKEHDDRISILEKSDRNMSLVCPFYPGRGGNGNDIMHRMDEIENTIRDAKVAAKWFWRGLIGFGITNLALAASFLLGMLGG